MLRLPQDKVAVTPIFDPDTSASGRIIIPDIAKERCDQGIVKYLGPDVKWVKQGMYVMFSGYTGTLINLQGEGKLIIMPEEFIVAEIGEVDNVEVPGLFYKSRIDRALQIKELYDAILNAIPTQVNINADIDKASDLASQICAELVRGGFFGPAANPYFLADYENIFEFMSEAFRESAWYRGIKVKDHKPRIEDYDKMGINK